MSARYQSGVMHDQEVKDFFRRAQAEQFAVPSMNVVSNSSVNAVLETAKDLNTVAMVQISHGGSHFYAGKSLDNSDWSASVAGAVSMAQHVYHVAGLYNVPVILHSDHAPKKTLPWVDGMLAADERNYEIYGHALFSSHMLDLSEESLEENIETCKHYLERMSRIGILLELEIGITGGEEDGVDNSDADEEKLYTTSEEVAYAYEELSKVSDGFLIAAAFGNVHGVYKPGNVKLRPELLKKHQEYVKVKYNKPSDTPVLLVFHGGSGSEVEKMQESLQYGVVKFNIDTDTQWAYWNGVREFESDKHDYLQTQIGNPEGDDLPNKKYYDPRVWLREAEKGVQQKLTEVYEVLGSVGKNKV